MMNNKSSGRKRDAALQELLGLYLLLNTSILLLNRFINSLVALLAQMVPLHVVILGWTA